MATLAQAGGSRFPHISIRDARNETTKAVAAMQNDSVGHDPIAEAILQCRRQDAALFRQSAGTLARLLFGEHKTEPGLETAILKCQRRDASLLRIFNRRTITPVAVVAVASFATAGSVPANDDARDDLRDRIAVSAPQAA